MDKHNEPPARRKASYDALASLLGVNGPLRLLPQGPAPKPHIVIKRDYSKDSGEDGEGSTHIARFSFIAGKKFSINKGQPLLFGVACPTDRDGKTLAGDDNTFVFEGELLDDGEGEEEDEENVPPETEKVHRKARQNAEGLPPKMRKSLTRTKAYASYIADERSHSLRFTGYPWSADPPRVYSTTAVQTDLALIPSLPQAVITPRIPLSTLHNAEKSPLQLPSPVSADHARETLAAGFDLLDDEETDNLSRVERSLSPMDLSSDSSSPDASPVARHDALPEQNVASSLQDFPSERADSVPVGQATLVIVPASPSVNVLEISQPDSPQALILQPLSPPIDSTREIVEETEVTSAPTANIIDSRQEVSVKKELIENTDNSASPIITNAVASSSKTFPLQNHAHARDAKDIPSGPRAMRRDPSPPIPRKLSLLAAPTFVKSTQSSIKSTWETSPPVVPYISASTSSNPLGIRPSSSVFVPQKLAPKAPRSLMGPSAPPKKAIVVGARWSAARTPTTNIPNGTLSTSSSSSSSLSSLPSSLPTSPVASTAAPPATLKTNLSQILPYASPSPPPPESDPPPPPPPEMSGSKWKRIASTDEKVDSTVAPRPAEDDHPTTSSLKRPHECLLQAADAKQLSPTPSSDSYQPDSWTPSPKRARETPPVVASADAKPARPSPASFLKSHLPPSASSQTPSKSVVGAPQKGSQPLMHPLPQKPVPIKAVVTGSSYRPGMKRERSVDPSDRKRAVRGTSTDWPPTHPVCDHGLKPSGAPGADGAELGVQKIIFNADGTQIAVLCSDRSVRIWENKTGAATELAQLCHKARVVSACWVDDSSVMTLAADGTINMWTRIAVGNSEWKSAKLLTVPEMASTDMAFCLAYTKDRIAVSMPSGVKVWLLISGTWQPQREIARSGVTAIHFVQEGTALIGGCRDGVLWYCEVPNGTLRVHSFLQKPILSIDLHPTGTYLLVSQEGGKCHLVTLRSNENKGSVERTYTTEKIQLMNQKGFSAVFATKGQAVLYGTVNGCALVWDRKKGSIVYGLKHPDGDVVQAAATFDGRPGVEGSMITGTKQGRLFWWPQPVAAAPSHSASGAGTPDDSRKRQKVA